LYFHYCYSHSPFADNPLNLFVKNISQLVTVSSRGKGTKTGSGMRDLGIIANGGVLCRDGKIAWVGPMNQWSGPLPDEVAELDATGNVVVPGFVDSHTHMLFAGDRTAEFVLRSQGATYQQIAQEGGGIMSTVWSVRAAAKKAMKKRAVGYLTEMMKQGTTTVEIKSGYGLDLTTEIKMLEAINELRSEEVITVVPTFIGAHAIPPEYMDRRNAYVSLVLDEMIPYVGKKRLAEFCDVFCDRGYFDLVEADRILAAGKQWGMKPKLHADELSAMGGAELAASVGAVSADHLEHVSKRGISALRDAGVVATLLPGVSFFLNHGYAPARQLIDTGVAVALASDFNPGSCMSYSMPMMMTIACTQMQMTPEEALTAATLHGAAALELSASLGSIEVGKNADLVVADVPDFRFLAYHFGANPVRVTIKNGTILEF
jgi:imidazolonepropionase